MTLSHFIEILKVRWKIALLVFLLLSGSIIGINLLLPKTYTASASVVVDIKSPDPIAGMVLTGVASPSYLITQIDVISSERVARKVISSLRLNESPVLRDKWLDSTSGRGNFESWLADLLRKGLDVRPARGSNVIAISYSSDEPRNAMVIANAFIQAYLNTNMELRTEPAKLYSQYFNTSGKQLRLKLEEAQAKLSEYQRTNGLIVTDERLDIEMGRLNELSSQLVMAQSMAANSGSRTVAAQRREQEMPEVLTNGLISSLRGDLVKMQGELEQISTRFGSAHPQVQELKSHIADLQTRLDHEIHKVTSSVGISNTINIAQVAQLRSALDEQRSKVLKMKAQRDEAALLQRDVDNAQKAYEGVMNRLNMTTLESQAVNAQVAALEYATEPSIPAKPRVLFNSLIGILLGLFLGIMAALVREKMDRKLRRSDNLEVLLQLPVFGTIPSFKNLKNDDVAKKRIWHIKRTKYLGFEKVA